MSIRKLKLECTEHRPFAPARFDMYEANDFVVRDFDNGWERSTMCLWAGTWEHFKMSGSIILDIGAYSGIYSLISNAVGTDLEIHAFEPVPPVFERLTANIELNPNSKNKLFAHNIALSNEDQQLQINITGNNPLPSGSSIDPHPTKSAIRQYDIVCRSGDSFIEELNSTRPVSLIKIDVEHHEYKVLQGLEKTLRKDHPHIFIELLTPDEFEHVDELLHTYGYNTVVQINDHARGDEVLFTRVIETPTIEDGKRNFLYMKA